VEKIKTFQTPKQVVHTLTNELYRVHFLSSWVNWINRAALLWLVTKHVNPFTSNLILHSNTELLKTFPICHKTHVHAPYIHCLIMYSSSHFSYLMLSELVDTLDSIQWAEHYTKVGYGTTNNFIRALNTDELTSVRDSGTSSRCRSQTIRGWVLDRRGCSLLLRLIYVRALTGDSKNWCFSDMCWYIATCKETIHILFINIKIKLLLIS
jgi:hypothetical protein